MDAWDAQAGASGMTWAQSLAAFLQSQQSPQTARTYGAALRGFFSFFGGGTPDLVRRRDIVGWRDAMRAWGRSESTVKRNLSGLAGFFRFLAQDHGPYGECIRSDNPAVGVKTGKVKPYDRARPMPRPVFQRLLKAASARTRAWLMFHASTGRRRSEVARLTPDDLRNEGGVWSFSYLGKGRVHGRLDIPQAVVLLLERWRPDWHQGINGNLWGVSSSTLARELKRTAARAGVDERQVHVHGLRHLAASLLREQGKDVYEIMRFLDHRSPQTTLVYLQQLERKKDRLADELARALLDEEEEEDE